MGNDLSFPTRKYVHYVHVRFYVDANEYVHVKLFPEDVSTLYQAMTYMRNNDQQCHIKQSSASSNEFIGSNDPREEKDVFLALHVNTNIDEGKNSLNISMIPKRSLTDIQKEREILIEPSGNEPMPITAAEPKNDETKSRAEKETLLQKLRKGETSHTPFIRGDPLFKEIFKS